ncbi:hypothetical protein [Intrasporangium flavum]|uniref:hypothetical protein n=1 Tax=Intrasporangium flavum TaxID=1428657 RepID=UPI00096CA745|nr:hypothetical protein [Intrasporangium flavum]
MTQENSLRRGGAPAVTAGNLVVAGSVLAALAAGPRVLGHEAFTGYSLAWTAITVFGYGLAMPTEQMISRRLNADPAADVRAASLRLALVTVGVSALALIWAAQSPADKSFTFLGTATVLGVVGWTVAAIARGRVAGSGDLRRYAGLFGLEGGVRIILVAAAIAVPESVGAPVLAAALGGPVLVAGLVGAVRGLTQTGPIPGGSSSEEPKAEQLAFVLVALGYQACLNAAPFVLERKLLDAPALIGAFVVTSSYYRFASVLAAGFTTPALVRLSHARARGDMAGFSVMRRRASLAAMAVSALATAAAAGASPIALPLLYGQAPDVPPVVVVGLAASTVVATTAAVAGTALLASRRAGAASVLWILGASVLLVLVALDPGLGWVTAVGLVAGPSVVLAGTLILGRRADRAGAQEREPQAGIA